MLSDRVMLICSVKHALTTLYIVEVERWWTWRCHGLRIESERSNRASGVVYTNGKVHLGMEISLVVSSQARYLQNAFFGKYLVII